MKNFSVCYILIIISLFFACSSGKNALKKGKYDTAVIKSINRLKQSGNHPEANQVLLKAYALAESFHLRKIEEAKNSIDEYKWETVLNQYQQLNTLYNELMRCNTCISIVPLAKSYLSDIQDSKYKAADALYLLGQKMLNENNRHKAKLAYQHFLKAKQFDPNIKGIQQKINEAYWQALLKVVVQPSVLSVSRYKLSNDFFQQQIDKYLTNYDNNKFVRFYSESEVRKLNIQPDHIIRMNFDDFVVGQVYVKEKIEKVKKDSVIIGENRQGKIYATVSANLSIFEKQVVSSGLLNLSIFDEKSNKVILKRKFDGTYVWLDKWAVYKGDQRALNNYQFSLTKKKETVPPPPATMFVEFTKPIYEQVISQINVFYRKY